MSIDAVFLALLDSISDAGEFPARWEGILSTICQRLGGAAAILEARDLKNPAWFVESAVGLSPPLQAALTAFWAERDASLSSVGAVLKRGILVTGEVAPTPVPPVARSLPAGEAPLRLAAVVVRDAPLSLHLTVLRAPNQPPFSGMESDWIRGLAAQARRVLQSRRRYSALRAAADGAWAALDRLPTGIVLVDAARRITRMNIVAQRLVNREDALRSTDGILSARGLQETAALQTLVTAAAAASERGDDHPCGVFAISRSHQARALQVSVVPVPRHTSPRDADSPVAALFLYDPAQPMETAPEILKRFYALTPAEARLAALLVTGRSVEEAADELGISTSTARTQLKGLFGKLEVHRQSDLVRLLLSGSASLLQGGISS